MRRHASLLALAVWVVLGTLRCQPAGPDLRVTWPGPVDIQVGAAVRYQGVEIGIVTSISLLQSQANAPAEVELGLRIDDTAVALREDDVFEIESEGLLGDSYVAITPWPEPSDPLLPGARIAGMPPLAVRMRDSADAVIESLGELAREKTNAMIEAWAQDMEDVLTREAAGDDSVHAAP